MQMQTIIRPAIFSEFRELKAGMSTKLGRDQSSVFAMNMSYAVGDNPSNVRENRKCFFSQLNISEDELAIPHQCHSNMVADVAKPGEYNSCDALTTNKDHVALVITIADCVPILLYDPVQKVIGIVHAGWKGTSNAIMCETIDKMKKVYSCSPTNLYAFIGPSAGSCCYEVGKEVAINFEEKIVSYHNKKFFLDLKGENKNQLLQSGLSISKIELSPDCTICRNDLYHSYRRDGTKSGRMMAVISIQE
jgi:YfiH family protein